MSVKAIRYYKLFISYKIIKWYNMYGRRQISSKRYEIAIEQYKYPYSQLERPRNNVLHINMIRKLQEPSNKTTGLY